MHAFAHGRGDQGGVGSPAIPMTTLLLTDLEHPEMVVAAERGVRARLWARTHASALDRALAAGACPDTSATLSLRAGELIGTRARGDIARSLREVVELACQPRAPRACSVPLCWRKILAARPALLALACRLESPQPVDARGVARARLLLTAGNGPLYDRPGADDLEPAVQDALTALEVTL